MILLECFLKYIDKNRLFLPEDKVLLAVSGGLDSVVMAHLFHNAGFRFAISHCNFQLRGMESDADEMFVASLASRFDAPFFNTSFETRSVAREKGISTQMAARDLRYEWFEMLRNKHSCHYLATAHHRDDNSETVLINLTRGTGLKGMEGIPVKSGSIIRPLMFASRQEIQAYALENAIAYREDSSNMEDKYMRNKIRKVVVPVLRELNPGFDKSVMAFSEIAAQARGIIDDFVKAFSDRHLRWEHDKLMIPLKEILQLSHSRLVLYELLHPFGFNAATMDDIYESLNKQSGKIFQSHTHTCLKDRQSLIVAALKKKDFLQMTVEEAQDILLPDNGRLRFEEIAAEDLNSFDPNPALAYFDKEKVSFPLTLRNPTAGDWFHPLGMKGKKKLSDFFIDNKVPRNQKEDLFILTDSEGQILWIVGHRSDNRFRVDKDTKRILIIIYEKHLN